MLKVAFLISGVNLTSANQVFFPYVGVASESGWWTMKALDGVGMGERGEHRCLL